MASDTSRLTWLADLVYPPPSRTIQLPLRQVPGDFSIGRRRDEHVIYGCAIMETRPQPVKTRRRLRSEEGVCEILFVDEAKVAAVQATMPPPEEVVAIADLFGVLSDPTRVRILYALSLEELCVCDLAKIADRSMPAISHQLQLLRRMRLVTYRTQGKLAYYILADARIRRLVEDAVGRSNGPHSA